MSAAPVSVARQATFNTEPADSLSARQNSVRRGGIDIPVVGEHPGTPIHTSSPNHTSGKALPDSGRSSPDPSSDNKVQGESRSESQRSSPIYATGSKPYGKVLPDSGRSSPVYDNQVLPESQRSSPIYATGSKPYGKVLQAKVQARRGYEPRGPPSIYGDSELEILSDVGLAGDSDTDVPHSRTPLSLSALKRTRKEPRLKVPSVRVDSAAPTIEEENTLDVIAARSPVHTDRYLPPDNAEGKVQFQNSQVQTRQSQNSNRLQTDPRTEINAASAITDIQEEEGEGLDSSFCESDWQPMPIKEPIKKVPPSDTRLPRDNTAVVEDKQVISKKYEREVKPIFNARLDIGKRWSTQRPISSDQREVSKSSNNSVRRRSTDETSRQSDPKPTTARESTFGVPGTPQIDSLFPERLETDPGFVSDWNNDSVSGVPKPLWHSHEAKNQGELTSAEARQPHDPPPTRDTMATSDGYDYTSETFEEVLQERNAMIKSERTYQKRIKQLEEELKGMINQCQLLSDENKELRKALDAAKKANTEKFKPGDSPGDNVALSARVARLETEKENLERTNEQLSTKTKDHDKKIKQFDIVFVENTKLKNKNAELERKVQGLEKQVASLSSQDPQMSAKDRERMKTLEDACEDMKVVLADVNYQNKALTAKVKSLESENRTVTVTLDEKRTELAELMRAMGNETKTETELKDSKARLDRAQGEIDSVKQEMEEMKKLLKESEDSKEKLRNGIAQRDSELKKVKLDQENKERVIADLRQTLDKTRQEVSRQQEQKDTYAGLEKDVASLKSRIGSLKAEIESSIAENQRLKQEREEANRIIDKLHQENANANDAITESKRYFRKWETERDNRNRLETDLAKKDESIQILEDRLREAGNKLNALHNRLKALEDERSKLKGPYFQETEANNKILKDENKRLRQMLVERNIELTHKNSEQQYIDTRIQVLERKQRDAELRVKQLSGWVSNMDNEKSVGPASTSSDPRTNTNLPPRPLNPHGRTVAKHFPKEDAFKDDKSSSKSTSVLEPKVAFVSPRSIKKGVKRSNHSSMTPPPGWEEPRKLMDGNGSNHTPSSLPSILDAKSSTPPEGQGGYFKLYQEKLKRMRDRRF